MHNHCVIDMMKLLYIFACLRYLMMYIFHSLQNFSICIFYDLLGNFAGIVYELIFIAISLDVAHDKTYLIDHSFEHYPVPRPRSASMGGLSPSDIVCVFYAMYYIITMGSEQSDQKLGGFILLPFETGARYAIRQSMNWGPFY